MAEKQLNKIFLSASIPDKIKDSEYYETTDIIAIRDAVRALATIVIPKAHLVWGGHPAITPLIRFIMDKMHSRVKTHITLYQSAYFEGKYPVENEEFEKIIITEKREFKVESLKLMRLRMISENEFVAGIFIGGMHGVLDEYKLFKELHPKAIVLPIETTGGAAKTIYNDLNPDDKLSILNSYAYLSLFKTTLNEFLL